ncbi:MAG TPA: energy transducer TonB [Pyrinomonadaceae bacterium]|jgi:protein TonB|nr:energy transducer TonB [Pyrinomonadaceae bacterium]
MFNNLIESDSHREELARKSRFFLGTLAFYALLFSVGGVASIYAYNAHLENQNLEVITLLPPVEPTAPAETPHKERPRTPDRTQHNETDVRRVLVASVDMPDIPPSKVSSIKSDTPSVRVGIPTVLGPEDRNGFNSMRPVGPEGTGEGSGARVATAPARAEIETTPPPVMPTPTPVPKNVVVSLGAVNGRMLNKPDLPYPSLAKSTGTQGTVTVQIVIDEKGKVVSARAVSGHPLLRPAAEQAAYQARFSPTLLSQQPVKASGTITFNFQLQK